MRTPTFFPALIPSLLLATGLSALTVALPGCGDDSGLTSGASGAGTTTEGSTTAADTTEGMTASASDSEGSGSESASEGTTTDGATTADTTDGVTEGTTAGTTDGTTKGTTEGTTEGTTDGTTDGTTKGTTDGTTTDGTIENCDDFVPVFKAEVEEIRGCTMDEECGQELTGTSCGCTRNWVARVDADVKTFYELVDLAGKLGCELPFISTCDCPETKGYRCDQGTCTWNYI